MQVHTGMGDSPEIDIRLADAAHLRWLISDGHFGEATIVLVHGGYPHHAGAGFLASAYPNVWLDVSEIVPFIGPGVTSRVLELFEMAPLSKITYGSDGWWSQARLAAPQTNMASGRRRGVRGAEKSLDATAEHLAQR